MNLKPEIALQTLREGNARFKQNLKQERDLLKQVSETRDGQKPYAAIVSCIDSRNPAELIFDTGIGDIFSVRMAGNVISEHVLGSLEFACKLGGARLIVVLGHTRCGAVSGACDRVEMGNLTTLLSKITPAIYYEKTETKNRTSSNFEFVNKVAKINVYRGVQTILEQSVILRDLVQRGEIGIIGGLYDVKNGLVNFYEDTWLYGEVRNVFDSYVSR